MTRRLSRFDASEEVSASPPPVADQLAGTMFDGLVLVRVPATVTSREAADRMQGEAANVRRQVVEAFRRAGDRGLTPDECADALGLSVLSVRPRCTELLSHAWCVKSLGGSPVLRRSGAMRRNVSGCRAHVLVLAEGWRAGVDGAGGHTPQHSTTQQQRKAAIWGSDIS